MCDLQKRGFTQMKIRHSSGKPKHGDFCSKEEKVEKIVLLGYKILWNLLWDIQSFIVKPDVDLYCSYFAFYYLSKWTLQGNCVMQLAEADAKGCCKEDCSRAFDT